MKVNEAGVIGNSQYFFNTPSNLSKNIFFYLISTGEFFCDENYNIQRDFHNSYLIMYIRKGQGNIFYDNRSYTVKANDIVLLDCHRPHAYSTDKGWETLWIHFDGNISKDFFDLVYNSAGCVISSGKSTFIPRTLNMICESFKSSNEIPEPLMSSHIHRVLSEILLLATNINIGNSGKNSAVMEAVSYIETNFKDKLTIEKVASHINMSMYHFSRMFKKETSFSPYEYIIKTRINHSKTLLKKTELNIKEVAFNSGFSSESNFVYTFHNSEGLTPGEFRNTPM
jgi:AraC-like DNA-binding protein